MKHAFCWSSEGPETKGLGKERGGRVQMGHHGKEVGQDSQDPNEQQWCSCKGKMCDAMCGGAGGGGARDQCIMRTVT